jgi:hypothetical protein
MFLHPFFFFAKNSNQTDAAALDPSQDFLYFLCQSIWFKRSFWDKNESGWRRFQCFLHLISLSRVFTRGLRRILILESKDITFSFWWYLTPRSKWEQYNVYQGIKDLRGKLTKFCSSWQILE